MNHLKTDPDQAAILNWSHRTLTVLEPVDKIPEAGEFLVSSLSVLTAEQFLACVAADVRITTADGIDTRTYAGFGDHTWETVKVLANAVAAWLVAIRKETSAIITHTTGIQRRGDGRVRIEGIKDFLVPLPTELPPPSGNPVVDASIKAIVEAVNRDDSPAPPVHNVPPPMIPLDDGQEADPGDPKPGTMPRDIGDSPEAPIYGEVERNQTVKAFIEMTEGMRREEEESDRAAIFEKPAPTYRKPQLKTRRK